MTYHILNGDAMTERFAQTGLGGNVVVMRECLIDRALDGDSPEAFYKGRAAYIAAAYGGTTEGYFSKVVAELQQLKEAPGGAEFNLWFGYDLFCAANMWFIISLLHNLSASGQMFLIYPFYCTGNDVWQDFGGATPDDLVRCFHQRILLEADDLQLAASLWQAYKAHDLNTLKLLAQNPSKAFPYLGAVCHAHIGRFAPAGEKARPESIVAEIIRGDNKSFEAVFREFFKTAGIYGFGDAQVKKIYDKLIQEKL